MIKLLTMIEKAAVANTKTSSVVNTSGIYASGVCGATYTGVFTSGVCNRPKVSSGVYEVNSKLNAEGVHTPPRLCEKSAQNTD